MPAVGLHPYERFPFRIVARDDRGNVGFEQFQLPIPHQASAGSVTFHTPLVGFQGGGALPRAERVVRLLRSYPPPSGYG